MPTQLIGICGAAGSGKSTVATHLAANCDGKRLRLADGLKRMLRCIGLTEEQVDGSEKNVPLPLLNGHTTRYAMTSLGTGWGRDMMGADLWVNICCMSITQELVKGEAKLIIVDDIRHENEVEMIRKLGGQMWCIRRPEAEPDFSMGARLSRALRLTKRLHPSETLWRKLTVTHTLLNDGTEDELKQAAIRLLEHARGG